MTLHPAGLLKSLMVPSIVWARRRWQLLTQPFRTVILSSVMCAGGYFRPNNGPSTTMTVGIAISPLTLASGHGFACSIGQRHLYQGTSGESWHLVSMGHFRYLSAFARWHTNLPFLLVHVYMTCFMSACSRSSTGILPQLLLHCLRLKMVMSYLPPPKFFVAASTVVSSRS